VKILLDECVDRRFARELPGHSVETVYSMNWAGIQNGELLRQGERTAFDVFIIVDRNLAFQQNVGEMKLSVVVLCAHSNRLVNLSPLAADVLRQLPQLKRGEVRRVSETKT